MEASPRKAEGAESKQQSRDRARSVGAALSPQLEAQKLKISEILLELSETGDLKEAKLAIERTKSIEGIEFTKRSLIFGIEHHFYERELISKLLSVAYDIFEGRDIADGFQLLLYRLPDLVLDVPGAPQILAKFISRAIYDEILPPAFVKDAEVDNHHAKEALALVYATVHSSEERGRLEHIWGPGNLRSVQELKETVDALLIEFLENPDPKETSKAISDLHAPSFSSQIVKQALRLAMDKNTEAARNSVLQLLTYWHQTAVMSVAQITRGFNNMASQIDDLKLDLPSAPTMFKELTEAAKETKLISVGSF